jgi:hypothetical protein
VTAIPPMLKMLGTVKCGPIFNDKPATTVHVLGVSVCAVWTAEVSCFANQRFRKREFASLRSVSIMTLGVDWSIQAHWADLRKH